MEFSIENGSELRAKRRKAKLSSKKLSLLTDVPSMAILKIEKTEFTMTPIYENYIKKLNKILDKSSLDKMPLDDITNYKIIKKFLSNNRWHVVLNIPFNGKKSMPQANYNWLINNPSFLDIPKGYLVHHLDLDELNDDISNLALMMKHHHVAYHIKHKNIKVNIELRKPINIKGNFYYFENCSKPKIYYRKDRNQWEVNWYERKDGSRIGRSIKITKFNNETIRDEAHAKEICKYLIENHMDV